MKFILQNVSPIMYDTQYQLLVAQSFWNWRNSNLPEEMKGEFKVLTLGVDIMEENLEDPASWCPVGSNEFCIQWFQKYLENYPIPRNVPEELFPLQHRKVFNMTDYNTDEDLQYSGCWYVKSNLEVKHIWNDRYPTKHILNKELPGILGDFCQLSEPVNILSEYRCFVMDGELLSMKHYSGDPFVVPDKFTVENNIAWFKSAPRAYTLDVCVFEKNGEHYTDVMEVHDFYSCGLYGFVDSVKYPLMLWRWFTEYKNKLKNE